MTKLQKISKRILDIILSLIGLILAGWLILLAIIIAKFDTKLSGIFRQKRIGQYGKPFYVFKIRTMKNIEGYTTTVSTDKDPRITKAGRFWRKSKIDELPQLVNVLFGDMSFVGPRPALFNQYDFLAMYIFTNFSLNKINTTRYICSIPCKAVRAA